MKKTFLSLYNATEASLKGAKLDLVKRKNVRAVEASIDSAEGQKLQAEEDLEKALSVVSNGGTIDVNHVLKLRQLITNTDATIAALKEFKEEFFAEEEETQGKD